MLRGWEVATIWMIQQSDSPLHATERQGDQVLRLKSVAKQAGDGYNSSIYDRLPVS
jgi:hypothetical protein